MIKYLALTITIFVNFATVYAQVTIGLSEKAEVGAVLQLKDIPNITDGSPNATKGLGLPRVSLSEQSLLYPMYDYTNNIPTDNDIESLKGLLIYNVVSNELICKGIHVWNGKIWDNLSRNNISYLVDTRVSNVDSRKETMVYGYQDFGDAGVWMLSNMRASIYSDGTPISLYSGYGKIKETDAYYYYPPANEGIVKPTLDKEYYIAHPFLGLFYTWNAAVKSPSIGYVNEGVGKSFNYTTQTDKAPNPNPANIEQIGKQGICPDGWHIPSDLEMNKLEKVLANDSQKLYFENTSNPSYMPTPWDDSWETTFGHRGTHGPVAMSTYDKDANGNTLGGLSRQICDGLNSGFSVYLVGFIDATGSSSNRSQLGDYWTSSKGSNDVVTNENQAWYRTFWSASSNQSVVRKSVSTGYMMSVRCKKN